VYKEYLLVTPPKIIYYPVVVAWAYAGGVVGRSPLSKIYESNFIYYDFAQFRKQHS